MKNKDSQDWWRSKNWASNVKYVKCTCKEGIKCCFEQISQVKMRKYCCICIENLPILAHSFSHLYPISNSLSCICAGIWCAWEFQHVLTGFKNLSKQSVISQDSYSDWLHKTSCYFCVKSIQIFTTYRKPSSERIKDLPQFQLKCLDYLFSFPEERSWKYWSYKRPSLD